METEIQTLLDSLADLREKANVNACFGEPVTTEGRMVIPVAEVAYGFGMGVGHKQVTKEEETPDEAEGDADGDAGGGGGGGGVRARPLAVIEVTPGSIQVKPIIDEQKLALAGAVLIGWAVFWLARALVRIFKP